MEPGDGGWTTPTIPDGLARLWSALTAPNAGDLLVSLEQGYECVDWGGATHVGGASHGALLAGDSLGPLVLCGLEPGVEEAREQWALRDIAALVLGHFGVAGDADIRRPRSQADRGRGGGRPVSRVEETQPARRRPSVGASAPATPPPAPPTGPGSSPFASTSAPGSPRTGSSCSSSASSAAPAT